MAFLPTITVSFLYVSLPVHILLAQAMESDTEFRETLDVDLKAGGQYFIRAQGESKGVPGILTIQHGRLDLMSCADAQKDMEKGKPLNDKALWKKMRPQRASLIVDESSPPSCQ